jgi:hypothetical protein
VNEAACREKVAALIPAPIDTDGGAVNGLFPVVTVTLTPPAGAFFVSVTVQVLEDEGESAVGLQTRDETRVVDTRAIVALAELPLYAAVSVALWSVVIAVVLALNEAAVNAAGTVIDDGAVRAGLLLVSEMTAPPLGAGWDRLTVQVLAAFAPRLVGLHRREETTTEVARFNVIFAELLL